MILSMTGYGTGEASRSGVTVLVELRAVNHRYFDPSIRISRNFAGWENRVRELLAARIARGRITASVEVESDGVGSSVVLDEKVAADYSKMLQFLRDRFELGGPIDPVAFAQLPDVLRRNGGPSAGQVGDDLLGEAMGKALNELESMRRAEGVALCRDLEGRVERIGLSLTAIAKIAADAPARIRKRLEERVGVLVPQGVTPDAERLATEVALLAEKSDIEEEIVRFRAHNEAFLNYLGRKEPVGKRLDFLLQEMNREANTIGSKALHAEVAHKVVEIKEEIERLREQVQNIE